jgi:type IV fimbrial biogenesis protein FimT
MVTRSLAGPKTDTSREPRHRSVNAPRLVSASPNDPHETRPKAKPNVLLAARQHRTPGFSLPETIGVLAIAGISVSLAVPSYQFLARADRDAGAVNRLVTTLQVARNSAITRNSTVTVCPSSNGTDCDGRPWQDGWIAWSAGADGTAPASRRILLSESAQPGLQIQSQDFASAIEFHANGGAAATDAAAKGGQFLFCRAGSATVARAVTVLPNGKVAAISGENAHQAPGSSPRCIPENRS